MPYTAPLKSSPSAQHVEYCDQVSQSCPSSPTLVEHHQLGRPHISRFYTSTGYLRRHRRSSSNNRAFTYPAPDKTSKPHHAFDPHSSIRQSPPPLSDALIPPGAIISPPESAPNSSDEESAYKQHREGLNLEELEAAVRFIEQRRVSSPERESGEVKNKPSSSATPMATHNNTNTVHNNNPPKRPPHPPLSKEARKISHSRSFTEHAIAAQKHEEALTSSPEESDRDDEPQPKHPMVRKKSGELVRPALRPPAARRRPSSMPGTPTYSKAVHFDSQLEHIRHFLQLDKPQAVSTGTSPVEDYENQGEFPFKKDGVSQSSFEWEIQLPNFPKDASSRTYQRVRLERLHLSSDKSTLVGMVAVANLAFQKHVAARFTFDHWKTVSEVHADYNDDVRRKQVHDGYDRFSFSIKLDDQAYLEKKTMFICIRYSVEGNEYWDNNNSMNYQVSFQKVQKAARASSAHTSSGSPALPRSSAGSRPTLPRSRTFTGAGSRPHFVPSAFDNFSNMTNYMSFGSPLKSSKGPSLCEDESHDLDNVAPVRRDKPSSQAFGNRYDFEASLSAAMRTKPEHDRTTLITRAKSDVPPSDVEIKNRPKSKPLEVRKDKPASERSQPGHSENPKPSSLVSGKPHRESSSYKELVDKYCFFGSPTQHHQTSAPSAENSPTRKESSTSPSSSSASSSPRLSPHMDVGGARNSSPSPKPFTYPRQTIQNNFLKETHTPTVIRG